MNGDRLRQARELIGMNQTELANQLGVSQSTIAYIENGRLPPSEALAQGIAAQVGFPLGFFQTAPASGLSLGSLLFRSKAREIMAVDRAKAVRWSELVYELTNKLMTGIKPLPVRVPEGGNMSPTEAARMARASLGVPPTQPLPNMVNMLERAGILVVPLPEAYPGIDGFSVWAGPNGNRPLIVLPPGLPPDRLRFSAAHELGHLVMHRTVRLEPKQLEKEAMAFAGEFLFPEEAVRLELTTPITLTALLALKPRWGVSLQALVMKVHNVGLISSRQRSYLWAQITARNWKEREPGSDRIPVEKPRAIRQLAELKYGSSLNYFKIANDMALPVPFVASVMEGCFGVSVSRPTSGPTSVGGKIISMKQGPRG